MEINVQFKSELGVHFGAEYPFTSYVDLVQWITDNYIKEGVNYQTVNSYVKRHFKAKLKVARKSHIKKDENAVDDFKKTSVSF